MRLKLVTFIWICMRMACLTVRINWGWLLVERRLVDGTFGCRRVNISWSHTKVLSNFGRMQLTLVSRIRLCMRMASSTVVINCGLIRVERRLGHGTFGCWRVNISLAHTKVLSNFGRMRLKLVTFFWICMRMASSTVRINWGWLLVELQLVHGTFWVLTGQYFVSSH
jgi:hypothetical protein